MILHAARDLGELIRDRRRFLGLTQENLAERVGVHRAWVLALERGKRHARVDLVFRTLNELGLTLRAEAEAHTGSSSRVELGEVANCPSGKSLV